MWTIGSSCLLTDRSFKWTCGCAGPISRRRRLFPACRCDPSAWTDHDVSRLLKAMLLAIYRAKNPDSTDSTVFLRGFSWIVNPYEDGGVVVAIEIQAGAAVSGPFKIDKKQLEDMVSRAIAQQAASSAPASIHLIRQWEHQVATVSSRAWRNCVARLRRLARVCPERLRCGVTQP